MSKYTVGEQGPEVFVPARLPKARSRAAVVALLVVDILASAFTAYELAGLYLPGWHTISWFAHTNRWVDYVIISAWLLAGLGGAVWFRNHARSNIQK